MRSAESKRWAFRAEGLCFSYGEEPIFSDLSFAVPEGEFLAVLGPNGGGKTTLLKLLLGLLEPDSGFLEVLGESPRKAASRVGYVPQDINVNKTFPISVLDVVLLGCLAPRIRLQGKEARKRAFEALESMEMASFAEKRIGDLSQGQRQRVSIARALVAKPEMLLLDEPTASVDPKTQEALFSLLRQLNRSMTIVLVSHDVMALTREATSVACVNRGFYYHGAAEVTPEMIRFAYGTCPVDLVAHGIPHRVLKSHEGEERT